jgi:hypothetical protein
MGLAHSPRIATDGLILCLDAGNNRSYLGSGTEWRDLSNRGNNGTLVNGVGYNSSNQGSLVFDGSNDYVSIQNITTSKSCSICIWFKENAPTAWSDVLTFQTGDDATASRLERHGVVPYQYNWYRGGFVTGTVLFSHSIDKYDYIVLTFDATNATCYKNGLQTAQSVSSDFGTASTIHFGKRLTGTEYWKGNMSSIQIYNRSLSATEVAQNFNALRGRYGV